VQQVQAWRPRRIEVLYAGVNRVTVLKKPTETREGVLVVGFGGRPTGGSAYEDMVAECLQEDFEVDRHQLSLGGRGPFGCLVAPLEYARLNRVLVQGAYALSIKTLTATLFQPRRQPPAIVICHHADIVGGRFGSRIANRLLNNLHGADAVVVVADYWNAYLRARGLRNVHTIHNAFRQEEYACDAEAVRAFRRRRGLTGKPIVYLGTYKPGKGVEEAFHALKDLDVHLVASGGANSIGVPLNCLSLDRTELVQLLTASSVVVTMSRFAEGWCRIAHEAMLCGTPVVGSGSGGMRELLQYGGQEICKEIEDLRPTLNRLLGDERRRAEQGRAGQVLARQFTYERFQKAWVHLVTRMCAVGGQQISAESAHGASQSIIVE